VAFAPSSGETLLLNDECAALVEELQDGPGPLDEICCRLAAGLELDADDLRQRIAPVVQQLIDIGLITDTHGATS
jgi:PqqD family protein of HPr-rel-A system